MRTYKLIIICLFFLALYSCTSERNFIYLQDKNQSKNTSAPEEFFVFEHIIKPGDMLIINVIPLDKSSSFSVNTENNINGVNIYSSDISIYVNSYNVDDSGFVRMPVIGKIQVKGFTISKCQENIQKTVDSFLKNSLVVVKLINYNITILGEVNRPGNYKVYNTKVNILEAIGMGGDLTVNGNRNNIMLIRQNLPNKYAFIDITDRNVINSDYFYLQPNDILYIKPNRSKFFGTIPFPFATVLSTITTLILILNYVN